MQFQNVDEVAAYLESLTDQPPSPDNPLPLSPEGKNINIDQLNEVKKEKERRFNIYIKIFETIIKNNLK
jgi:hypothetical protein